MKWITRSNVKVDRVACPWLIERFIDPQAEFVFAEEQDLLRRASQENAIPFDAPQIPEIKLNHRGERCTFDAILEDYSLADPALARMALIVRAADVKGLLIRQLRSAIEPSVDERTNTIFYVETRSNMGTIKEFLEFVDRP